MLIRALQAAAGNFGVAGYNIENSLRFNDNDSAYLSRTPASAGNRKTWTWSGWVKRGNITTVENHNLFECYISGTDRFTFNIASNDTLSFWNRVGGSYPLLLGTSQLLRDTSGWYHIVLTIDTTNATSSDRAILYINGVRVTDFSSETYPSQNSNTYINTTNTHIIGRRGDGKHYLDGYMAEVNFIDGQALTADDFGQIDAITGEWSPKAYEGTYGTNGFYLPFNGNANDDSGNGNNWTENNLASTDYMIDTPTNNFATYLQDFSLLTLSEGNLETFNTTVDWQSGLSSIGVSSGKWYAEYGVITVDGDRHFVGITPNPTFFGSNNNYLGQTTDSYGYYGRTGSKYTQPAGKVAYGAAYTAGDIIGVALDMDAGTVTFYKNNVSQGVAFTGLTGTMFIGSSLRAEFTSETGVMNFGADSSFAGNKTRQGNTDANGIGDFYYTPPTGYLALCTDNLPAPAIEKPETQFNVVTYTGTGTTNAVSGVGFQPDFVWIKNRSAVASNKLIDVVRGAGQQLESDTTNAEATNSNFSSFDSDGFTVVGGTAYNSSGNNYVAWCWKAGGTAASNTDGSITSQVSANVDAGFSIVSYTGTGANATIGHGLSSAPEMMIVKDRDAVQDWNVYHHENTSAPETDYLVLNSTAATADGGGKWNDTAPTNSVFTVGTASSTNASGNDFIAYCFHSVEGFSKIGTYVGNGSADGPFVYTGFKPAFVLSKRTDTTEDWVIHDSARNPENVVDNFLYPNLTLNEQTLANVDFLANGFKWRANNLTNRSGGTYIYMVFAEHPFNYATGR